jgi:hypothetical protein
MVEHLKIVSGAGSLLARAVLPRPYEQGGVCQSPRDRTLTSFSQLDRHGQSTGRLPPRSRTSYSSLPLK